MLADPAAFSEAAKYFFEALSGLDDVSDKPITSLIYPCSAITSSFSEHTVIFNLKDVGIVTMVWVQSRLTHSPGET